MEAIWDSMDTVDAGSTVSVLTWSAGGGVVGWSAGGGTTTSPILSARDGAGGGSSRSTNVMAEGVVLGAGDDSKGGGLCTGEA